MLGRIACPAMASIFIYLVICYLAQNEATFYRRFLFLSRSRQRTTQVWETVTLDADSNVRIGTNVSRIWIDPSSFFRFRTKTFYILWDPSFPSRLTFTSKAVKRWINDGEISVHSRRLSMWHVLDSAPIFAADKGDFSKVSFVNFCSDFSLLHHCAANGRTV
jgi:hypothetical protein